MAVVTVAVAASVTAAPTPSSSVALVPSVTVVLVPSQSAALAPSVTVVLESAALAPSGLVALVVADGKQQQVLAWRGGWLPEKGDTTHCPESHL